MTRELSVISNRTLVQAAQSKAPKTLAYIIAGAIVGGAVAGSKGALVVSTIAGIFGVIEDSKEYHFRPTTQYRAN